MWVLESDGPLFAGKRLWLRPGSAQLFGRVKEPSVTRNTDSYVIEAKSVSKKHLKISVAAVRAGTGSHIHDREELIIEDFSKLGTTIDGEKISQATKVLKGDEHSIKVSKYEFLLRIKWQPVVLTISDLSKTEKQNIDPLHVIRQKLERLGIKFVQDYLTGITTHVVANKRNLPPVLQALIYGKYAITREYVNALFRAAREEPTDINGGEPRSSLERDFDAAWPDPMQYVPEVANEPVPRDARYLAPNTARLDLFHGYTFVFCQRTQYENLLPVITAATGKALLMESFQEGQTGAHDLVAFVKNVAGDKSSGELKDGANGVVVVRVTVKSHNQDWARDFIQQSDVALNQRSIEQKELLDPILTVDTSKLRQRLDEDSDRPTIRSSQVGTVGGRPPSSSSDVVKSEVASGKKKGRRLPTQRRFKGFDEFDGNSFTSMPVTREDEDMADATPEEVQAEMAIEAQPVARNVGSRKRAVAEIDDDAVIDEILPATAAMKRRRLDEGDDTILPKTQLEVKSVQNPRKEHKMDVLEVVKKQREIEDEKARQEAESLRCAMDDVEIEGPANLAVIEEMELRTSTPSMNVSMRSTDRWEEKWNGRPNYKRFRRKGERPAAAERSLRVIVPLEQVKKKDFGIGEEYWLESSAEHKPTQRQSHASQNLRDGGGDDDGSQFRRRRAALVLEDDEDDVEIVGESNPVPPESSRTRSRVSQTQIQEPTQTRTKGAPKRQAVDMVVPEPVPVKRPRQTKSWQDSDDDDELTFRRSKTIRSVRR